LSQARSAKDPPRKVSGPAVVQGGIMIDYLKTIWWANQSGWLARRGDDVWDQITDTHALYEPIDGNRVPLLAAECKSDRYCQVYALTVVRNVAVMHAVLDTGMPQVIRQAGRWVLCDPEREAPHWADHRRHALLLTADAAPLTERREQ
jgi:hypothetical protein